MAAVWIFPTALVIVRGELALVRDVYILINEFLDRGCKVTRGQFVNLSMLLVGCFIVIN